MLEASRAKTLYRMLYCADLTAGIAHLRTDYGAVLSAGTFTHGHLGPEPLVDLLALARPNGLFCIGVNAVHFQQTGFADVLSDMQDRGLITQPQISEVKVYEKKCHDHSSDIGLLLHYRKAS